MSACGCDTPNTNSGFNQDACGDIPISGVPDFVTPETGCGAGATNPATTGSSCPTAIYTTGDFEFVVRNKTTGRCERVTLDFIQDSQPVFP